MSLTRGWLANIKAGIGWGLWLGLGCIAMLGIATAITGAAAVKAHFGQPVGVLAAGYVVAGVGIGALVGAVLPLVRSEAAAKTVGFFAGLLAGAAGVPLVIPRDEWFPGGLLGVLLIAAGIGMPLGGSFWKDRARQKDVE